MQWCDVSTSEADVQQLNMYLVTISTHIVTPTLINRMCLRRNPFNYIYYKNILKQPSVHHSFTTSTNWWDARDSQVFITHSPRRLLMRRACLPLGHTRAHGNCSTDSNRFPSYIYIYNYTCASCPALGPAAPQGVLCLKGNRHVRRCILDAYYYCNYLTLLHLS